MLGIFMAYISTYRKMLQRSVAMIHKQHAIRTHNFVRDTWRDLNKMQVRTLESVQEDGASKDERSQ